jgi:ribonuclease HI
MPRFSCRTCGDSFDVPSEVLARYPGWTPSACARHRRARAQDASSRAPSRGARGAASRSASAGGRFAREGPLLTPAEVLARFPDPGQDGIFTDGACVPNPGPGGWGVVWVEGGKIRDERSGHDPATTNNRMELRALIEAYRMLPEDAAVTVHSDSNLCVQTVRQWAPGWAARGWKRKDGEIANLDLVKELYALARSHPRAELVWIRAHAGHRWNEYADALASLWLTRGGGAAASEPGGR